MKQLNNSVVLILLLINLFASSGVIIAACYYPDSPFYVKDDDDDDYLNPLNITFKENLNENINGNFSYFDNYIIAKYNLKESKDKSKHLYSLNLATYINFLTIYMCFYLICSFFVGDEDCPYCTGNYCDCDCSCNINLCNSSLGSCNIDCSCEKCQRNKYFVIACLPCFICFYCCDACCRTCIKCTSECCIDCGKCCQDCCNCSGGECKSSGGQGDEGMAGLALILCAIALAAAIIAGFFYLIYFLTKTCGKAIVRYVSFFINTITNIIVFCLAYSVIDEKENSIYVVLGLSGLIFISNIIGIILSNIYERFYWCDSFSIKPTKEKKFNQGTTPKSDFLEYNLEAEANRDPDDPTPSKEMQAAMIESQTYK